MIYNFQICNTDTDSISFCTENQKYIVKRAREELVKEINEISPEFMEWADDGYYKKFIILKAKNYITQDEDGKVKYKGSGLKSSKLEPALKEFLYKIIDSILNETYNYSEIYQEYVNEILNLKDIKRWVSKKTISNKTMTSERSNETKIKYAIQGKEYVEGDKVSTYFKKDGSLSLIEDYKNDHDPEQLLGRLYSVSKIFTGKDQKTHGIIPKETFLNYSLKKNFKLLQEFGNIKK